MGGYQAEVSLRDVQVTNCSLRSSPLLPASAGLRGSGNPGSALSSQSHLEISALVSLHVQCLLPPLN